MASKWLEVYNTINSVRSRRGSGTIGNPGIGVSSSITANILNTLTNNINYYWSDGTVSTGTTITAAHLNYVIDKVVYCGTICVCNCAYCTCNCNYCTCDCDYSCTCNCNYSDKRLKTNIKYIGIQNGLKLYSYNYIWDKNTIHKGVMAQEILETKYKSAIKQDKDGYYMVDYSKLPINLKGI